MARTERPDRAASASRSARLERLFEENQTDLTQLLQARQRLIQLENARLDALWQATQAQADLLTALGAPSLLGVLPGMSAPARGAGICPASGTGSATGSIGPQAVPECAGSPGLDSESGFGRGQIGSESVQDRNRSLGDFHPKAIAIYHFGKIS